MSITPEYRRAYLAGWQVSVRHVEGALERADDRNVIGAWYEGYMDYAAGREKWHIPLCVTHGYGICFTAEELSNLTIGRK